MDRTAAHRVLTDLREALEGSVPVLTIPSSIDAQYERERAIRRLDDHILARLSSFDAPLLAVVGGSTGSGKSTLLNSFVRRQMSSSSPIRPTTRRPLLLHHPEDEEHFVTPRVLPHLARVHRAEDSPPTPAGQGTVCELEIRQSTWLPKGLALLDSPDIDSVSDENRALARQLLDAADLWLFVTTAARYADAVPWELLTEAGRRGIDIAVVLNRVPVGAEETVEADLRRMMSAHGLAQAPIFTVTEGNLTEEALIPRERISGIDLWLRTLAEDSRSRALIAERALRGSVSELLHSCDLLVEALAEEESQLRAATALLDEERGQAINRLTEATADGSLLRGEVLARWQDVVGAADLTRSLSRAVANVRDRITAFVFGRPTPIEPVEDALEAGLAALVHEELLRVRQDARRAWRHAPATKELIENLPPTDEEHLEAVACELTRTWQKDLLALVRSQGQGKRSAARIAAVGVNVVTVALVIVLFASTGGLTGVEVGISAGGAVLAQKLLETIFGDQAVRSMTRSARALLIERVELAIDEVLADLRHALPLSRDVALVTHAREEAARIWNKPDQLPPS